MMICQSQNCNSPYKYIIKYEKYPNRLFCNAQIIKHFCGKKHIKEYVQKHKIHHLDAGLEIFRNMRLDKMEKLLDIENFDMDTWAKEGSQKVRNTRNKWRHMSSKKRKWYRFKNKILTNLFDCKIWECKDCKQIDKFERENYG